MSSPNATDDERNSNVVSDMTSFTGTVTNSLRNTDGGWGSSEHAENTISNERVSSSYRTSNSTQPYHNNLSESDTDSHGMAPEQQIFHVLNEREQSRECSIISEGCNDELENDISLSCNFSVNTINADSPNGEQEYQSSDSSLYDSIYEDYLSDVSDNENQDLAADENLFYFRNLQNLLENEDYAEIIRANFVVNRKEVLLAILMFVKRFSLPMAATVYCCKMINSFLSMPVIPDTHYSIDNLCYPKEGIENHAVCPKCKSYVSPFSKEERRIVCSVCNLNIDLKSPLFHDYFTILDVKMEIKNLIESNSEYYTLITSARHREPNHCFKDIYDGIQYKKFVRSLPDTEKENYITATFNSDGSAIFKSSKYSVWPLQININEVPFNDRKKPITFGLWFGHNKPTMTTFLKPFVEHMKCLSEQGIPCIINNEVRNLKLYALCCCVDSVARAPMQGMVQFNGYYGCNWCLHPGELVPHGRGNAIKYPILNDEPEHRTEESTINHLREALTSLRPYFGVKNATPLLNLKCFNIIEGFVPDAMHCIALGVVKQFTEYWFNSTNNVYSLSKQQITRLDSIISSFKVPNYLVRLSRSINDRKFWKSREYENWLLFYSLPLLQEISVEKHNFQPYVDHWALLVRAFYILTQESILREDIYTANRLLRQFVALTESLYTKDAMTYNVHQLVHIAESVCNWGPLWAHSGYPFENGNGQIIKMVHAANGVINQICRNICMKRSLIILQDHVKTHNEYSPVLKFCSDLTQRFTSKCTKLNDRRYFGVPCIPDPTVIEENNLSQYSEAYDRLVYKGCLYQTIKKNLCRSNNSFAFTSNGDFIQIVQFIADNINNTEVTVYNKVIVENAFSNVCTNIKKIVNIEKDLNIILTANIERICVYMKIKNQRYICALSNMYLYS